jgi:hypothetical protein
MLEGIKRLFTPAPAAPPSPWADLSSWASGRQCKFREVPGAGFVVEGRGGATPWRLEWGPSQRAYIDGSEVRIRAELGLPKELHVLLMNRQLQEGLEESVFEQCVEGVQTHIDDQTPPEMRWLVMYAKLSASEMALLDERYAALSNVRRWLLQWLAGALTPALVAWPLPAEVPLVLMITRGRLQLRTALPDPHSPALHQALRLFETALFEARRVLEENLGGGIESDFSTWFASEHASPPSPAGPVGRAAPDPARK